VASPLHVAQAACSPLCAPSRGIGCVSSGFPGPPQLEAAPALVRPYKHRGPGLVRPYKHRGRVRRGVAAGAGAAGSVWRRRRGMRAACPRLSLADQLHTKARRMRRTACVITAAAAPVALGRSLSRPSSRLAPRRAGACVITTGACQRVPDVFTNARPGHCTHV
jgi:hypothetical protein